jgi:hypothetical protein
MDRAPTDVPSSPVVVLTSPGEDASPQAFRTFVDEVLAGPEPQLESVHAADVLRAIRADG